MPTSPSNPPLVPPRLPSERTSFTDPATGAEVIQWTAGPHKNQSLYFTSPSVTTDDRWLVFLSERTGGPNLFALDRDCGEIHRLSENDHGLLYSYVYPRGGNRGLSKASPCLDAARNLLYYIQDDIIFAVTLGNGGPREIFHLPPGWRGAFTHISPDGRTLCVPCTDPRAFVDDTPNQWEQMRKVPGRMEESGLVTRLYLIDLPSGTGRVAAEIPFWVTHVQFDPAGTGRILFNREGFDNSSGRPPHNRIWCLEPNGEYRPLSPEPPGEWRTHENWTPDGSAIVYHGGREGEYFVATRTWEGELIREISVAGLAFWHATGTPDGRLLVDRPDGFISILDPLASSNRVTDVCRHDSIMEDQDAHPHPLATPSGRRLVFTSLRSGHCHVYETALPPAG